MVREIVHDEAFLSLLSENAMRSDRAVIVDLVDTLAANSEKCVGMAANIIGSRKNIIAVASGPVFLVIINPVIIRKSGENSAMEGCLSLTGERECIRYREIDVEYLDFSFRKAEGRFSGFTAEIIQYEIDHIHGIVI